jgi:type IV secretory pathway TraG/TraD family ATPase VirD4
MLHYAILLALFLLFMLAVRWCFVPHGRLPRFRVRYLRARLLLRLHPGRGHATIPGLWLRWGRFAAFRRSRRSRPSLPAWVRFCFPDQHSLLIGRAHYRHGLRIPVDEHVLVMAPPRTGKTGLLAKLILRYPGPVVATTTKADVFQLTSGVRSMLGPVEVFNPQGIGRVPSTFRWNPIDGCEQESVAIRRADGFANAVSLAGTEDGSFWSSKASSYLRCLFHAAALVRGDLRLVTAWALGDAQQAEEILESAGAYQWALELAELRGDAQKTAATIKMVMSRALAFMTDSALAQSVLPAEGDGLQIGEFLARSGTLYLIAESDHDDSPVAPLFAAMAGEIRYVAAQVGQASPAGRLDPPLLMALDEIVQTCPIALPTWLADSGGKGIQLIPVAHGEAQLRTRWGYDGARVVLDTCGVKVLLPGISDPATLQMASDLCGQAAFREHGLDFTSRHDVMTPDMIRQLPVGYALVVRGGFAPVIAKLGAAWRDSLYKHARARGTVIAALTIPAAAGPESLAGQTRTGGAVGLLSLPDLEAAPDSADPDDDYRWNGGGDV